MRFDGFAIRTTRTTLDTVQCETARSSNKVIVSCTDDSGDTKFRYTSSGWVTTNKEYWIIDNEINNFVVA